MTTSTNEFPRETSGLPATSATATVELADGDRFALRIAPVSKRIGDATVRMLAYNGSIPGPTLRVPQGSELLVDVENQGDMEATVHWHGLRLENRFDGTHETQEAIPVGGRYSARVAFPDPGIYWYHPHIREDYNQEMGLYGNVIVVPSDPDYWPPVHRELALTLDDVLIEDGQVAAFSRDETTYAAMGRFGNVLLVAGEPELALTAQAGEVVRLYLTNTANTRVFKVALPGARMKLVGGDSGRCEREEFVEDVVLAPSERVVVDVLFEAPGKLTLEHRTPDRTYTLADVTVTEDAGDAVADRGVHGPAHRPRAQRRARAARAAARRAAGQDAGVRGRDGHGRARRRRRRRARLHLPDAPRGRQRRARPLPELRDEAHRRSRTDGVRLPDAPGGHERDRRPLPGVRHEAHPGAAGPVASRRGTTTTTRPTPAMHEHAAHGHSHEDAGGIEWEDDMVEVNKLTTPENMRWKLVDRSDDAENHAIDWQFRVGDRVKIRLVNEMDSDHPMHHPFHIHGAGRFLILARDGAVEPNLVWSDTVLVRTGETVDIVLEVTNVGRWMAHCHIAEHHESGMMFSFDVTA